MNGGRKGLIVAALALILGPLIYFAAVSLVHAYNGPPNGCTPPNCNGAISTNSNNNLSVGTSSVPTNTKFLIVASSTDSTNFAFRVVQPASTAIIVVRNDGNIGIATTSPAYALDVVGTVRGTTIMGSFTGTAAASNVTNGVFGSCGTCGGGAYSFPSSLGVGTSTNASLPQTLSVYGNGFFTGDISVKENSYVRINGIGGSAAILYTLSNQLMIQNSGSSFLLLENDGRIGIMTASPKNTLDILGSVAIGTPYAGGSIAPSSSLIVSGNVGIGTSTPGTAFGEKLAVNGAAAILGGNKLYLGNSTNGNGSNISSPTAGLGEFQIATGNNAAALFINNNGNVGIGTVAPGRKLDVVGSANNTIGTSTAVTGAFGGDGGLYTGRLNGTPNYGAWMQVMRDYDGMTFPLILNPNGGNVGIATTSPAYALSVSGDINLTGTLRQNGSPFAGSQWTTTSTGIFYSSGNVGIGTTGPQSKLDVVDTNRAPSLTYNAASAFSIHTNATDQLAFGQDSNSPYEFWIQGRSSANAPELISINPLGGNVGIGATGPGEKLEVAGGLIKIPPATATDNDSPGITIVSNDDFLYDGEYINHYGLGWHNYNDGAGLGANAYLSGYYGIDLFAGGAERLRINNNGNVGIATTSPAYTLDVNGTIRGTSILGSLSGATISSANVTNGVFGSCGTCGGGNYAFPSSLGVGTSTNASLPQTLSVYGNGFFSGNVGIGTTSPGAKLAIGPSNSLLFDIGNYPSLSAGQTSLSAGAGSPYSGKLQFGTDGTGWKFAISQNNAGAVTDIMTFVTGGNVGIGTSTPAYKLDVWNPGGNPFRVYGAASQSGATGYPIVEIQDAPTTCSGCTGPGLIGQRIIMNDTPGAGSTNVGLWVSATNGTAGNIAAVFENGNVGIGTAGPSMALEIDKTTTGTGNAGGGMYIRQRGTGDALVGFQIQGVTEWLAGIDNSDSDKFKISNVSGVGDFGSTGITIDTSGNVGIGTSGPGAKLQVTGTTGDTSGIRVVGTNLTGGLFEGGDSDFAMGTISNHKVNIITNNSPRVTVLAGGNVGIGNTAPLGKLTVNTVAGGEPTYRGDIVINQTAATEASTAGLEFKADGAASGYGSRILNVFDGNNAYDLRFQNRTNSAAWSTKMTIQAGGNVGIGTTGPGATLDVLPSGATTAHMYVTSASCGDYAGIGLGNVAPSGCGNYKLLGDTIGGTYLNASSGQRIYFRIGNSDQMNLTTVGLGIATNTPAYALDVVGTIRGTSILGSLSGATMSSANVTNGVFGSCGTCGGGNYSFPSSLGVGTSTNGSLPQTLSVYGGGFFSGNVGIGVMPGSRGLYVQASVNQDVGIQSDVVRTTGNNYGLITQASGAGADINQGILASAANATTNYGIRIYNVLAGANNYALYSDSAAQSYFQGNVGIGTTAPAVKLQLNNNFSNLGGRLLTSNDAGWLADGSIPLMVISDSYTSTLHGYKIGLDLHNDDSTTYGSYSPAIMWSRRSASGGYNSAFAGIAGQARLQGPDTNWVAGDLVFYTGRAAGYGTMSERMRLDYLGNVGIGTTAPARLLHVEGSGSGRGQISLTQSGTVGTDSTAGIYWHSGPGYGIYRTPGAWTPSTYQQLALDWDTGIIMKPGTGDNAGYDKSYVEITQGKGLRVTQGYVGIGTTSPAYPLSVTGDINFTGTLRQNGSPFSGSKWTASGNDIYYTTGNVGIGNSNTVGANLNVGTQSSCCAVGQVTLGISELTSTNGRLPWIQFHSAGYQEAFIRLASSSRTFEIGDSQGSGARIAIMNNAATAYSTFLSGNSNSYFQGGNLSVGSTNSGAKLDVQSSDDTASTNIGIFFANNRTQGVGIGYQDIRQTAGGIQLNVNAGTTGIVYVGNVSTGGVVLASGGGNVGIGDSSPEVRFDINAPAAASQMTLGSATGVGFGLTSADDGAYGLYAGVNSNGNSWIQGGRTNSATAYDISLQAAGGNVGIGTTAPNGKLDVYTTGINGDGVVLAPGINLDNNFTIQSYIDANIGGGGWAGRTTYAGGCCNNIALQPDVGTVSIGGTSSNYGANKFNVIGQSYFSGSVGIATSSPQALLSVGNNTTGTVAIFGGGTGKITVGTVDPLYTIGGKNYATYGQESIGVNVDKIGTANLKCAGGSCKMKIDFANAEEGSDFWLFAKTTNLKNNFKKLSVILTPSFDGRVWYEKDIKNSRLVIYGVPASPASGSRESVLEVSYRLSAPRFDSASWPNSSSEGGTGFVVP